MPRQFNQKNPTEMGIVRMLAYGEGLIHKEDFIKYANKTLLSRYKTAGLVEEYKGGEKGLLQITDQFKRAYREQIDPKHTFSGSHAPNHASGLNRVLSQLSGNAPMKSGSQLQWELKSMTLCDTNPYYTRSHELIMRNREEIAKAEAAYQAAATDQERAARLEALEFAKQKHTQAMLRNRRCSIPDLAVTLTRPQLESFIEQQREYYDRCICPDFQRDLYEESIRRMEQLAASERPTVTLNIEIITDNYGRMDIQAKENWSFCTDGGPVIYIPA